MSFVHKFEQLIHNSFQELPMSAQKPWVLSNNVPGNPTKKNHTIAKLDHKNIKVWQKHVMGRVN